MDGIIRTVEALAYLYCMHFLLRSLHFFNSVMFSLPIMYTGTLICLVYSHIGDPITGGNSSMVSLRRRRLLCLCSGKTVIVVT
jgi:hypothetical protein